MSKRPGEPEGEESDAKQPRLEEEVEETTVVNEDETETTVAKEEETLTEETETVVTSEVTQSIEVAAEDIVHEEDSVHVEGQLEVVDEGLAEGSTVVTGEDGLQYTITEIQTEEEQKVVDEEEVPVETVIDAGLVQNIIVQHMDIAEPLQTLRKLLETRLQCSLGEHEFFLQDSLQLDPDKNLVEQCVQGEGMVQINVEVVSSPGTKPKINIVDILKPAEEIIETPVVQTEPQTPPTKMMIPDETEHITRWIVDQSFRKEQERLKIPFDPSMWNETHTKHWIQWAIKEFSLEGVAVENFNLTGKQLCELQHPEFSMLIPYDRGDVFWTHLELLRKCKFVATIQPSTPMPITTVTVQTSGQQGIYKMPRLGKIRTPRILGQPGGTPGNRTGNNGQIQLWQFLLDLLTDRECREIISWVGENGEFKLNNPEMVARLWGERKNKPTMNYEKLSRALRYYYDGDMIAKVHGKRFMYKFVCDLQGLLGYSAAELNQLVSESAEKKLQKVRDNLRPGIIRRAPVEKMTYMMVEKVVAPEVNRTEVVSSINNIQLSVPTSGEEITTT